MKTRLTQILICSLLISTNLSMAHALSIGVSLDSIQPKNSVFGRVLTGYECAFQQRQSDPVYPAYSGAFEFVSKGMVNFNVGFGQSNSVQKRNLFGYDYSWQLKYTFIGVGADFRVKMTKIFTYRNSASLYHKFVRKTLNTDNEEIVPFLKEPFQRKLSFGLSMAVECELSPSCQLFLEGGWQITVISVGLRLRIFELNRKE